MISRHAICDSKFDNTAKRLCQSEEEVIKLKDKVVLLGNKTSKLDGNEVVLELPQRGFLFMRQ